jgi:5-methylcytosine-specific restriction protein A
MTARSVPEWVGSSPDAKVPPRVRLRVFEANGGICHISGREIMPGEPWELEHKVALINGGEHRESNMAPALKDKHRAKTAEDVAEKSAVAEKRKKHLGIRPSSRMAGSRSSPFKKLMNGQTVRRNA